MMNLFPASLDIGAHLADELEACFRLLPGVI